MRIKALGWVLFLGAMVLSAGARAAEVPAAAPQPAAAPAAEAEPPIVAPPVVELDDLDGDAACEGAEVSTLEPAVDPDLTDNATTAAGCKPCKGRTWCKCTYNGMPRSSCDPCCYTNNIGVTVCLD